MLLQRLVDYSGCDQTSLPFHRARRFDWQLRGVANQNGVPGETVRMSGHTRSSRPAVAAASGDSADGDAGTRHVQDTVVGPQILGAYAGRDYYSQNSLDPGFRVL